MDDLLYKIALTKIPLVGAILAKTLISYSGGVKAVFEARKKELLRIPGIGQKTVENILSHQALFEAEKEVKFLETNEVNYFFYLDSNYPRRLKHFPDCPLMLYYNGNTSLDSERMVAMVGTRQPSVHGIASCEQIVEDLKPYNVTIISGLAFGIDIAAHQRCLELAIPTIGVLGHGLQHIYPSQHRRVANKMTKNGGLLTEYSSNTGPEREHFPMRNRIIAGLCDALIVLETARKGGSMISAQIAADYNKDVFALPGRVTDANSQGCNYLIKTHKAALMESATDIAYIMGWERSSAESQAKRNIQQELFIELSQEEKIIVDLLSKSEWIAFDKLAYNTKLNNSKLASLLLNLELKGLVKPLPGKQYVLISRLPIL